jgi:beta-galactosidase/beta-glucuronidase
MNLAGHWRFCTEDNSDFAQPGYVDSSWKTMSIPANWFLGGLDHHGVVWFRHEFRHRARREFTALHFDGVDYFADVYLNGEHLGHHTGYFDPFAFDVTEILRSGKNILAVRVESPYETPGPDGWYLRKRLIKGVLNHHDCRPGGGWEPIGQSYNTGGIWNRVYLEQHGAVTIDRLLLRADMDSQPPALHAELTVRNRTRKRRARLDVRCAPENFKGKVQTTRFTLELPEGESVHSVQIPVEDIRPWQPWDRGFPHLYEVSASLVADKESISRSSLFGFRTVRVEAGFRWFINGHSYFLRGSNYLPSQWLAETLFPEAASGKEHPFGGGAGGDFYSRDVALAKEANLNILRVHAHMLPPEFHEACDRAGLLVWQDFPFQWGYSDELEFHAEAERQMRAMITGLYNHPSIAAWCCHNESPWDAPWMAGQAGGLYDPTHNRDLDARLEAAARELDPARYVHRNSGTGDGHTYPGWYVGHWRDYQNLPAAPFITEYGAQGLPVRQNVLRMLPQFGPDAGYAELVRFKGWLDSQKKISATTKTLIRFGTYLWNLTEKNHWKSIQEWMKGWGIKIERSTYKNIPPVEKTPKELRHARDVWETWRFHDFQPAETFDNGIALGVSLDQFIANSQAYQSYLIQYATECYRRAKYTKVTGIFQFDFSDPWPAVTWSVVDYWRTPKPAFDALRRSMQPVLPCFRLPENMEAGKAILISFCIVNDLTQAFPSATCEWRLEGGMGDIASATFPVDIPADGVSAEAKLTLPSLGPGKYKLLVTVTSSRKTLGENWYELTVQ